MADDTHETEETAGAIDRLAIVRLAILVEGGLLVAAAVFGWLLEQNPVQAIAWTPRGLLEGVIAVLPMLVLFVILVRWPIGPLRGILNFSERVLCPLLASCSVIDLLGISVLAGVGEELLFRGIAQAVLCRTLGLVGGIVLASILFGGLHAITWAYAVLAAFMGAYLGCVWLYTDNLLPAMVAHALYDFAALLWLLRGPGSAERRALPLEAPSEQPEP
jgi:membrane protease YdiL (CAAX protease family)